MFTVKCYCIEYKKLILFQERQKVQDPKNFKEKLKQLNLLSGGPSPVDDSLLQNKPEGKVEKQVEEMHKKLHEKLQG